MWVLHSGFEHSIAKDPLPGQRVLFDVVHIDCDSCVGDNFPCTLPVSVLNNAVRKNHFDLQTLIIGAELHKCISTIDRTLVLTMHSPAAISFIGQRVRH